MRCLFVLYFSLGGAGAAQVTRSEVIAELNYARQNPQVYASYILMRHMDQLAALDKDGNGPVENWAPVSEAIRALRAANPVISQACGGRVECCASVSFPQAIV